MTFKYLNKLTTATIIAFTLSGCASTPLDQDRSEQLFFGGPILTMEGMTPTYAEALLVKDGKIIFVGSKKQAEHLANSNVQSIDLKNKILLPSFIDAHSHVNMVGFHQMVANLYPAPDGQVSDIDSLVQVLTQWKKQNPQVIQTMGGMDFGKWL